MPRNSTAAALLGCAAMIAVATAPAASAGTTGGPRLTARIRAAAVSPAPLVTDSVRAGSGKQGLPAPRSTTAMAQANAERQAAAISFLRARWAREHSGGKCTLAQCLAGMPLAKMLAGSQQPQFRNYWCGPATVSEMLAQLHASLTQTAAAAQLGTNQSGTDWSDKAGYPVPAVLDAHQTINSYVAVPLPWTPTAAQVTVFEADLVADMNYGGGVPLAANAYEVPGGPHLVGHPASQTIMHWFDIRGYSASGSIVDYEDSVHGASAIGWAAAVPAYSSLTAATIVDIAGARGYVW